MKLVSKEMVIARPFLAGVADQEEESAKKLSQEEKEVRLVLRELVWVP